MRQARVKTRLLDQTQESKSIKGLARNLKIKGRHVQQEKQKKYSKKTKKWHISKLATKEVGTQIKVHRNGKLIGHRSKGQSKPRRWATGNSSNHAVLGGINDRICFKHKKQESNKLARYELPVKCRVSECSVVNVSRELHNRPIQRAFLGSCDFCSWV